MKFFTVLIVCYMLIGCASINKGNEYSATKTINEKVVFVKVITNSDLERSLYGDEKTFFWGEGALHSKTEVIKSLRVTLGQDRILIPYGFFSDLANPRKIDIKEHEKGFIIQIIGGTTSAPYKASIIVGSERVAIKRGIVSPTFPDNLNQTDVFKSSFPKDM